MLTAVGYEGTEWVGNEDNSSSSQVNPRHSYRWEEEGRKEGESEDLTVHHQIRGTLMVD